MTTPLTHVLSVHLSEPLRLGFQQAFGSSVIFRHVERLDEALALSENPQLVIVEVDSTVSLEASWIATIKRVAAVMIICPDSLEEQAKATLKLGANFYMKKPIALDSLGAVVSNVMHLRTSELALLARIQELEETIELRKLVERAKGILMEQQGFSEDEAHRTLQKLSQAQGVSLKEFCRSLIQVKMVLGMKPGRTTPKKAA